jgi:hypothetical protein
MGWFLPGRSLEIRRLILMSIGKVGVRVVLYGRGQKRRNTKMRKEK